jgi:hypothetical protein
MATAQGAQQGPQPSVKEQIEQKAGLMALQQMQQQQMQQQAQPRGPMPAPAGVPQPEPQPEAPMMAASGGLARIPVRRDMFEYAGGGIIAFASGGEVDAARASAKAARERLMSYGLSKRKSDPEGFEAAQQEAQAAANRLQAIEASYAQEMEKSEATRPVQVTGMPKPPDRPPAPAQYKQPSVSESQATMAAGPQAAMPATGVKAAAEVKAPPRPAPKAEPQSGLPAASAAMTPQNEISKLALESVREKPKATTPEEIMEREKKFAAEYGLDKKFGEEERGLLALMRQRQAEFAKTRPMEELGATLRGFGQGYGGASAAGERAARETYEMDLANQREALNAINAINKENLVSGRKRYETTGNLFGKSEESTAAANRERVQALARLADVSERSMQAQLDRLNNLQIARLRAVEGTTAGERVTAQYLKLKAENKPAEAEALLEAHLRVTKGGEKEDTLRKEIDKKRVEIAAMPDSKIKEQALAGLAALVRQRGGGATAEAGKVPPPPPGFKLN